MIFSALKELIFHFFNTRMEHLDLGPGAPLFVVS